jgi:hypothetical protein
MVSKARRANGGLLRLTFHCCDLEFEALGAYTLGISLVISDCMLKVSVVPVLDMHWRGLSLDRGN